MNETLKLAIRSAVCACFGLQPSSDTALAFIREVYTEPENTPIPARTTDVLYWSLVPGDGPDPASYNVADAAGGSHKATVQHFLPWQLLVVCYGPGCEANAHRVRSFLYLDGSGFPRQILRKAGVYPVPDPPAVDLLYEPEGSLWRRRADVRIPLRIRDSQAYENRRSAIQSAPAVVIHRQ